MTGKEYELHIGNLLRLSGNFYKVAEQVRVGQKPWGGGHVVDVVLNDKIIVSLKHQESPGSICEKNIAEVICLDHAVKQYGYEKAILVLSDPYDVMRTKNFLMGKENLKQLGVNNVEVVSDEFFRLAFVNSLSLYETV